MDILLATPINKTHYCVPPLGLGFLISALRKAGFYSVCLLDSVKENMDYKKFADFLEKNKPRILGIQCFSFDVPIVDKMLKIAKDVDCKIVTIVGGPHPSAVQSAVFKELNNLDFAMQGEGEISFSLFVEAILNDSKGSLKDIPGLIYRDSDRFIINPNKFLQDIDSLDMPAWDFMDPRGYPDLVQGGFYKSFPVGTIISSRGCPYGCTFCANKILMGRRLRSRSIEKVVEEIKHLINNYSVKEIHILDDNFTINKKRVLNFSQLIKENEIKVDFAFPNGIRFDSLDEEILSALKEIGVYSITVGIESGSQRILNDMNKDLILDSIKDKLTRIKKMGFIINAFFIIGYPTETKEDIMKTINFAKRLPVDMAHFSCFLPLPGTDITRDLLASGRLKEIKYSELFYSKTPFSPEGITRRELKRLQQLAFLSFYLRPRILIGLILRLKSLRHLTSIIRRMIDYVF